MYNKVLAGFLFIFLITPVHARAEVFRLNKIVPVSDIKLHSIKDKYKISLPIPERWHVKEAKLQFAYTNSTALLAYKSRLVVALDDIPLGQFILDPKEYERNVTIKIPGRMLAPGYHFLSFEVAQHVDRECEDPFAPELWTFLRLGEATLSVDFDMRPVPLKLSALTEFIEDPKQIPKLEINIMMGAVDKDRLEIASVVSGGLGARLEYRPVRITASSKIIQGVDNIVIAPRKELSRWHISYVEGLKGPSIEINHLPMPEDINRTESNASKVQYDAKHALIIITGDSTEDVKIAAKAFSAISFPFPESRSMEVKSTAIAQIKPYHRKRILRPGTPVRFADLGFKTTVFAGMSKEKKRLEFFLPPDLYIKPNQYAVLLMHFGFGGAVRKDSSMRIELNGKPVSSVHLDNEDGAFYERYKILLPTYLFKPGKNVLTFQTTLMPLIIRRCEGFQDMNLFLTLFEDSTIAFPEMAHWGKLPEVHYFFDSGFPFNAVASGKGTVFLMPEKDFHSVTLAMNIVAYLGQLAGIAPTQIGFVFNPSGAKDKEIIFIGAVAALPSSLMKKAPLVLDAKSANAKYPQFIDLAGAGKRTFWQRIEEKLEGSSRLFPVSGTSKNSEVTEDRIALDNQTGIIMEFESPLSQGRSVLLWTAGSTRVFSKAPDLLWTGRLRSIAKGDLVLYFINRPNKVYSLNVGETYYRGKLSETEKLDFILRSYPWILYSLLAASFVGLAIVFASYLRWRRKKRLANEL